MRLTSWHVFSGTLVAYLLTSFPASPFNAHVYQAAAFLHGHFYLWNSNLHEVIAVGNRAYIVDHGLLGGLLMIPSVLIQGLQASEGLMCILLGAIGVALAYRLTSNLWLTVFLAFGTIYWYESILGAQWGFCLVLSTIPTLLALIALKERWSPYLVGLFAGLAFLSRGDLALAWPVYLCLID